MGDRVRVVHDGDGRLVAAKSPPPDDPDRARREAVLLTGLHHPGVVDLVELTEGERGQEVVTRWVGSRTAADLPRPLDPARAAGLVLAVAATVADLHRLGVVHGALDATHVLLDPVGRPVLCGFGQARRIGATEPGNGPLDDGRPSVDVAGLGSLLIELLAHGDGPTGGQRWPSAGVRTSRRTAAMTRSLLAVAQQATIDDPTCRPGVRAFADAVRAIAPDATLGPRPDHDSGPTTTDPLLALLADTAEPVGVVEPDPPSIDAPRVTDVEPATAMFDELDRLRPPNPAPRGTPRSTLSRLGGVSLVLGLAVLGFLGVSVVSGETTPVPAALTPPPDEQPTVSTTTPRVAPNPPTSAAPTDGRPAATDPQTTTPPSPSEPSTEIEHLGVRYRVGEPGDLVAVGDWRCTGEPTPALYRPSTGSLFVFTDWPRAGDRSEVAAVLNSTGGRSLVTGPPDDEGCPTLILRSTDGRETVIDRVALS